MRRLLPLALLLGSLVFPLGAQAQSSGAGEVSEEARRQFSIGVSLLDDPAGARYEEAYEAFHRAYDASPTPKILSNVALCAMMLERDGEAIDAYRRYLAEVTDIDPRERDKIEKDLAALEARGGTLELSLSPPDLLLVDTRTPASGPQVVNRYPVRGGAMTLRLRAGQHRLALSADGHRPAELTFDLAAGATTSRQIALAPVAAEQVAPPPWAPSSPTPAPSPPKPTSEGGGGPSIPAIVGLVLTGALAVGAGICGGLALKAKSDYASYETGGDRADAESIRSTGETLNVVTDVLIGTAAASAVVSLVLLLVGSGDGDESTARLRLMPGLVEGRPGVVLETTF